jgi:hypothetical protein
MLLCEVKESYNKPPIKKRCLVFSRYARLKNITLFKEGEEVRESLNNLGSG